MCGLVGCVGVPKNHLLSHQLITNLMKESQIRGHHASGHFAVDLNEEVDFFKIPIPAKIYTRFQRWRKLQDKPYKALIGHTRYSTRGNQKNNNNNHPFVSESGNIGLIHNGTLHDSKIQKIKYAKYLGTQCDTELLLLFVLYQNNIIKGIKEIFKTFGYNGDFACFVIYRNPKGGTKFYCFRDPSRPARFIDARAVTGQYYFCSNSVIWRKAIESHPQYEDLKSLPVEIIPAYEIWSINCDSMKIEKIDIPNKKRRKTAISYNYKDWEKVLRSDGTTVWRKKKKHKPALTLADFDLKKLIINPKQPNPNQPSLNQSYFHMARDIEQDIIAHDKILRDN